MMWLKLFENFDPNLPKNETLEIFEKFDVEKFEEMYIPISFGESIEMLRNKVEVSNVIKNKINNISKLQTTFEYNGGLVMTGIDVGATIYELPDDWFITYILTNGVGNHYRCDQFEGLVELLKKYDFA